MAAVRVLCLFTILNRGGAETMCMNLYRNIDRTKVQFDFLVYYEEQGIYEEEIQKMGGRIYRIPHIKSLDKHIKGAKEFFSTHKEYYIIHNHMGANGAFICQQAKKKGVSVIIYHSHFGPVPLLTNSFSLTTRRIAGLLLSRMAMNCSTTFFACGEEASKVFPKKYKSQIIRNAIDIDRFVYNPEVRTIVRSEQQCGNGLVIGNVARFDINKNQLFAVQVFNKILELLPDSQMWFIGDGDNRKAVEKKANELGISQSIKFMGIRTDVEYLLQGMDVYMFPSIKEGLPVACIEAQASGLPCVFSDGFDSTTSITDNCVTLSLSDPVEEWARTIVELSKRERHDTSDEIKRSGYDIKQTSSFLQNFYLLRDD